MFVNINLNSHGAKIPAMYCKSQDKDAGCALILVEKDKASNPCEKKLVDIAIKILSDNCKMSTLIVYFNPNKKIPDPNNLIKDRPMYEASVSIDYLNESNPSKITVVGIKDSCEVALEISIRRPEVESVLCIEAQVAKNNIYKSLFPLLYNFYLCINEANFKKQSQKEEMMTFLNLLKSDSSGNKSVLYFYNNEKKDNEKKSFESDLIETISAEIESQDAISVVSRVTKKRRRRGKSNKNTED